MNQKQTLDQALANELHIWSFGRQGNSLTDEQPPFSGTVVFDPLNEKFKIRVSSTIATFQGMVQCKEVDTVDELRTAIKQIETYNPDQLANYIKQFVPKDNQPIIP